MVFAQNVTLLVTLAMEEQPTIVTPVTQVVQDSYMRILVLHHAQKVIMLKQLQRLVNNVTIIARLVMDQMKMTVYLVTSQDITIILHLLV
jgi:hypothetical protein